MDVNKIPDTKDGDSANLVLVEPPSILTLSKPKFDNIKKKRRRGKTKHKLMKPYLKSSWQERRRNEARNNNSKRNNRFRKIVLANTQAPFNNNQFLMEIHKPEPENNINIFRTPSARTRDSSFSIDSEENYFFSLPEDEEEYLTKEFSSVYEDAQSERLSNMSKNELIQEYLLLEAKYENLIKRSDRMRARDNDEEEKNVEFMDKDHTTEKHSMLIDKDSSSSILSGPTEEQSVLNILQRLKEQEDKIRELEVANEKLKVEMEVLKKHTSSSSEDSESDSSSSSDSCSSSSCNSTPKHDVDTADNNSDQGPLMNGEHAAEENGQMETTLVNGFHNSE